jgi:1-deoxy-D-xylulose-5-phosphate reductoisomerase
MRLPIQYAFSWPDRWDGALPTLNLLDCQRLEFEAPDRSRFPCLRLAYEALEAGDAYPVVLNAANEVAVASFLDGAVPFPAIAGAIDAALTAAASQGVQRPHTLADIRELDAWARTYTGSRLQAASAR